MLATISRIFSRLGTRPSNRQRLRQRPTIEALEDRSLMAVFSPLASAADGATNSLRAAVIAANTNGQDDVVNLQAGTYQLSIYNTNDVQENAAAQGDLDLTDANHTITFQGAGAGVTIIDAGQIDRIFQVMPNVTAVFRDLTIRNGFAMNNGETGAAARTYGYGGGILNTGTATLERVTVENCTARGDWGVSTSAGGPGRGGGILNFGTLSLVQSTVRNNYAIGGHGAAGDGGSATGGGIASSNSLSIIESTLSDNHALGGRGGDGAEAVGRGGEGRPGGNAYGGGLYIWPYASPTVVTNSTISGNETRGGDGGQGGYGSGMFGVGGKGGKGGAGYGAGISAQSALTLANSTVTDNQANGGMGGPGGIGWLTGDKGYNGIPEGGGIWSNPEQPLVTSVSSIIAGNRTSNAFEVDFRGQFVSAANTLLGSSEGSWNITHGQNGNLVGTADSPLNPLLGPLANNGGPTQTHALLPGSPALNAGSNLFGLTRDQRGVSRVANGAADIGAFEVVPVPPPAAPVQQFAFAPQRVQKKALKKMQKKGRGRKLAVRPRILG